MCLGKHLPLSLAIIKVSDLFAELYETASTLGGSVLLLHSWAYCCSQCDAFKRGPIVYGQAWATGIPVRTKYELAGGMATREQR